MKTTFSLDERLVAALEGVATRQGMTVSELVEEALRRYLRESLTPTTRTLPDLPPSRQATPCADTKPRKDLGHAAGHS